MTRKLHNERQIKADAKQVVELVRQAGGQTLPSIAKRFGFGRDYMQQVIPATGLHKIRIHTGQTIMVTEAEYQSRRSAEIIRRRATDKNRRARTREAENDSWEIQRRYIKAGDAPMPTTSAANSVWQWRPAA